MKICAIIAEYNPFHNGHLYHIAKAKAETGCDTLIVLMSGSFTQRGDICVADKTTRANWAIQAGADCVFELPIVYTLSPAHNFAYGALKTLKPLGKFMLSFGSECGNLEDLESAVDCLTNENKEFKTMFKNYMSQGFSVAKSRTLTLDEKDAFVSELVGTPNNILGVEYLKAARALKMDIDFHTVKRFASAKTENFLSSTQIRKKIKEHSDFSKSVPPFVKATCPDYKKLDAICLYALNTLSAEQLHNIANIREGFENRLKKFTFTSMSEVTALTSKRYTKATIKRIAACSTLGLKQELLELALSSKPYLRVLALREDRKDILSLIGTSTKNLFLKPSDCSTKNKIRPLIDMDEKAAKLLSLIQTEN
ncbi:MAG: nucleotidyltransferase family protein [Clostridia bacterium]|nr:nucleotidyltransferase family protein [Clostridia bacterium]